MNKYARITPEGTRDLLFEESIARREAERMLCDLFVCRGFSEVMTPGIEFYDVFQSAHAIAPETMYKMTDNKGRLLVMRPDSTMPIARLVATRLQKAVMPIRLYYAQDVFRLNQGLSGRYDQIFQAGVELIGAAGERADLEVLSLAAQALGQCAGKQFRMEIGHVGFFQALLRDLNVTTEIQDEIRTLIECKNYAALSDVLDTLPPSGTVDALRRLPRLFGGQEVLKEAQTFCQNEDAKEALAYLARTYEHLCHLGLAEQVMIDLGLVHRNGYYTGVVFRGYMQGSGDTVVSGGRYDTLLPWFGSPLPAIGFGVNVDSLTKVMLDNEEIDPPMSPEILVHAHQGREIAALQKVEELINEGILCEFSVFDTLEESLAYAEEKNIFKVIAIGDEIEIYEI